MTETNTVQENEENLTRLQNFPVSFFSIIMGLSGFAISWEKAGHLLKSTVFIDSLVAYGALLAFVVIAVIYINKIIKHPDAVKAEIKHPVKLS
ncbi:MAG TPA: C4-dicarboxylate ABC transporter, partial [Leucothrix mucor]|nr:C4-dicarboxylate ABC transporter [Leucothrix mucor]